LAEKINFNRIPGYNRMKQLCSPPFFSALRLSHPVFIAIFLFVAIALVSILPYAHAGEKNIERSSVPVTEIRVMSGSISLVTTVQGVVETMHAPQISSMVSAEVVKVNVDEGDKVVAGQVLARMDDERFRLNKMAAKANIERLQAQLENQQLVLKRDQSLFKKKTISDSKLDASMTLVKQTRAQIRQAKAQFNIASYELSHTRIIAPITGIIQKRSVSKGDYINPMSPSGKPLFQIIDTHHVRARLYFPETLADAIKPGMDVVLNRGSDSLRAKITRIRPMLEQQNHSLQALVKFNNNEQWKPGESITASVVLQRHDHAVIVPQAALVQRPAGFVVYQIENGRAEEKPVVIGIRQGRRVEIKTGLKAGVRIALDGAAYLSDGVRVNIQKNEPQVQIRSHNADPVSPSDNQ